MQPEGPIRELARKTAKSIVDHGSIPMATLKESIILQEKVDALLSKEIEFPEQAPYPEIPEVDLTPIEEKLDEILAESKKKDLLEYDLQIDENTRKKLKGDKGDSYVLTQKDKKEIAAGIDVPIVEKVVIKQPIIKEVAVTDTPDEIADKINTLEEKIELKTIKGAKKLVAAIDNLKNTPRGVGITGVSRIVAGTGVTVSPSDGRGDVTINALGGGSGAVTFETVSKNLDSNGATFTYTGSKLTSIAYVGGITKTLNYTGSKLTSLVLSGSTPVGIDLTKTLSYTGTKLTGATYS
jgi:hypothetical protein